jgi:hypothetical protein
MVFMSFAGDFEILFDEDLDSIEVIETANKDSSVSTMNSPPTSKIESLGKEITVDNDSSC